MFECATGNSDRLRLCRFAGYHVDGRTVRKQVHHIESRLGYYWDLRSKNAQNIKTLMCPLYCHRGDNLINTSLNYQVLFPIKLSSSMVNMFVKTERVLLLQQQNISEISKHLQVQRKTSSWNKNY